MCYKYDRKPSINWWSFLVFSDLAVAPKRGAFSPKHRLVWALRLGCGTEQVAEVARKLSVTSTWFINHAELQNNYLETIIPQQLLRKYKIWCSIYDQWKEVWDCYNLNRNDPKGKKKQQLCLFNAWIRPKQTSCSQTVSGLLQQY